jgi:hypothetical protein
MELVRSKALLEALYRSVGPSAGLIDVVRARAAAGLIRAMAQQLIVDGETSENAEIPKQFWAVEKHRLQANWSIGDFAANVQLGGIGSRFAHIRAFGVGFALEDALKMGADFGPAAIAQTPIAGVTGKTETVEEWAARMVARGVNVKGFTALVLKASWLGPEGTLPLVKVAEAALQDAWKNTGYHGRGRRPQHLKP